MGTMLITGGSGAIGAELVRRLVAEPKADRIAVLTRAPGAARQAMLLESWQAGAKVPVGFVRGSMLTLADAAADMRADITHVLHLAADTRFSAPPEELRAANVDGTAAVLAFAGRCPRLSAVAVASTVYVAGLRQGTVREPELEHEAGFANAYEASKHEMERITRAAMRDLPVAVYRLSTAIGEEATGRVTSLNAFHTALRLVYGGMIPMIPGAADTPIDLISTDYAARTIQHLLGERFQAGATYHLCAGASAPLLGDLLEASMRIMRERRPAWRKRAIEMPVLADERTYELFARSVLESGDPMMIAAAQAVESFARQLTRPKVFDTSEADAVLAGVTARPDSMQLCEDVIRYCIENEWRAAA